MAAFYTHIWTENFGKRNNVTMYLKHLFLHKALFLCCFQFALPKEDTFFGYVNIKYVIRQKKKEEEKEEKRWYTNNLCFTDDFKLCPDKFISS